MDIETINRIVDETTTIYRTSEPVVIENIGTTEVINFYGYPPVEEATEPTVDMIFVAVGVERGTAQTKKAELIAAFGDGVGPESGLDYRTGPSFIHIGADLGSQEYALRLMALGSMLGLGIVTTPMSLGVPTRDVHRLAAGGLVFFALLDQTEGAADGEVR